MSGLMKPRAIYNTLAKLAVTGSQMAWRALVQVHARETEMLGLLPSIKRRKVPEMLHACSYKG